MYPLLLLYLMYSPAIRRSQQYTGDPGRSGSSDIQGLAGIARRVTGCHSTQDTMIQNALDDVRAISVRPYQHEALDEVHLFGRVALVEPVAPVLGRHLGTDGWCSQRHLTHCETSFPESNSIL